MQKRKLGGSGLEVSPLAFGGNVFDWTADEPTSFRLLDAFVEAGFDLIDTANSYPRWDKTKKGGESEVVLGNWMKARGNRSRVVVATKVGSDMGEGNKGLSKAQVLKQAEDSLRRLQTDYIDLYQSHHDDPAVPVEETLEAYAQLFKQGKVRAIGASNFTAQRLDQNLRAARQRGLPCYACLQPRYNLYDREDFERNLRPFCLKENLGVIPYYPLAAGFLTGKYRSEADLQGRPRAGTVKNFLNERGYRILKGLDEVASETGSKPATVALAWTMAQPGITAPIASATSLEQLGDILASAALKLSPAQMEKLDQASAY